MSRRRVKGSGSFKVRGDSVLMRCTDPTDGRERTETASRVLAGVTSATERRKIANRELARFVARVLENQVPAPSSERRSVDAACDAWLVRQRRRLDAGKISGDTLEQYRWACGHVRRHLGDRRVKSVSSEDIAEFYLELGKTLKGKSITHVAGALYGVLELARRRDWRRDNPARDVESDDRPRAEEGTISAPTEDELERFTAAAQDKAFDYLAYVVVSAATGGRRGAVAGLRKCDLRLEAGEIRLNAVTVAKRRDPADGSRRSRIELREGSKSARATYKAIGEGAVVVLGELVRRLEAEAEKIGRTYPEEGFIFSPDPLGARPYAPDTMSRRFKAIGKLAGVKISPHQLRHYAATVLAPHLPESEMMGRFDWRTPRMVRRYADYRRARDGEAAALLDRSLRLVKPAPAETVSSA